MSDTTPPGSSSDIDGFDGRAITLALLEHFESNARNRAAQLEQIEANTEAHRLMLEAAIERSTKALRPKFPFAGSPDNPRFREGTNAPRFLKEFESLLDEYEPEADDERKITLLERNVEHSLQFRITMLEGFESGDWELLKDSFCAEFVEDDCDRRVVGTTTPAFVEMVRAIRRIGGEDLLMTLLIMAQTQVYENRWRFVTS